VDVGPNHPGEESPTDTSSERRLGKDSGPLVIQWIRRLWPIPWPFWVEPMQISLTVRPPWMPDWRVLWRGPWQVDVRALMFSIDNSSPDGCTQLGGRAFCSNSTIQIVNGSGIPIQAEKSKCGMLTSRRWLSSRPDGDTGYFHATYNRTEQSLDRTTFSWIRGACVFYGVVHTMRGENGNQRELSVIKSMVRWMRPFG